MGWICYFNKHYCCLNSSLNHNELLFHINFFLFSLPFHLSSDPLTPFCHLVCPLWEQRINTTHIYSNYVYKPHVCTQSWVIIVVIVIKAVIRHQSYKNGPVEFEEKGCSEWMQ